MVIETNSLNPAKFSTDLPKPILYQYLKKLIQSASKDISIGFSLSSLPVKTWLLNMIHTI